ncbi:hypothetical protein [Curtobacterium flaccumfaciens]|uniref:hypothetical protein n=1 Tax=Curtobacterium flaccumfaciens TaxID=2035 RepID=UPI00220F88CF|nr:hypothetical protein [Curtobacterium flaccumfaciens]UWD79257.1 hypothetical protein NY058_00325 [Curtobacterium flaccumfaciens]
MPFKLTPPGRADLERAFARIEVPQLSSAAVPEPGSLWRAAWDDNVLIAAVLRVELHEVLVVPVSLSSTPSGVAVTETLFATVLTPSATPIPAITLDSKITTQDTVTTAAVRGPDEQIRQSFWDWSAARAATSRPIMPSQLTSLLDVSVSVALDLVRGNRLPDVEQTRVLSAQLPEFFTLSERPLNEHLRSTMLMRKYRQPVLALARRRGASATAVWRQSCAAIASVPLRSQTANTDWEARADYFFSDVV